MIWVEGESEGRVGAICFNFPQPLAFFGFSPHNFLIRAKMHKSEKETKGRRHDPPSPGDRDREREREIGLGGQMFFISAAPAPHRPGVGIAQKD